MNNKISLKSQATKGMFWSIIDKFGVQIGQFIIGIVLARLLLPEDFGLIGMLGIFLAISSIFVSSGMGSGLIQRQERKEVDFSTVFVFNLVVSSFFYGVLFITAPYIADFFGQPLLTLLARVLGIQLLINAFALVQRSKLIIAMDFKSIAKVNVIGVIVGGSAGLSFAFLGFGVWALVVQALVSALASVIALLFYSTWKFSLAFSRASFNALFSYSSKILLSGLYAQVFNNVYNITIGKFYPAASLGFYTRAKGFAELSSGTIIGILQQVTFPILATVQNDEKKLVSIFSRLIKMSAFFIFPVMTLLAVLAEPIVLLLLTEKWKEVIPLMQWMVLARIFYPISVVNLSILKAVGRSDLFLKVDLAKFPIVVIALIITIPLGIKAMVIGHLVTSCIAFFFNAYLPGKLYGYGGLKQLKDMFPIIVSTLVMSFFVFGTAYYIENLYLKLLFGGMVGVIVYTTMSYLFKAQELVEIKELLRKNKK